MITVILVIAVAVILIFSLRWFDRREIEPSPLTENHEPNDLPPTQTGPQGYERINSPAPQQETGDGQSTQGLFLGAHTFLNYRSTQGSGQNHPHVAND